MSRNAVCTIDAAKQQPLRSQAIKVAMTCLVLSLGSAMNSQAVAQPANDAGKLMTLSDLYIEGSYNTAAHACTSRFPQERDLWNASLPAWKTRNAKTLEDARDLDTQLAAAVRAAPEGAGLTQEDLLALRTFGTVRMLSGLAEVQDTQARKLCTEIRDRMDEDIQAQTAIDHARAVARGMLAKLRREPR